MTDTLKDFAELPVDGKLARIYQKLLDKCEFDSERFEGIDGRLDNHETRINTLEVKNAEEVGMGKAKTSFIQAWGWLIGPIVTGGIIGLLVLIGQVYLHIRT